MEKFTELKTTSSDKSYVATHEFGHAAFASFFGNKVVKMSVNRLHGGGSCSYTVPFNFNFYSSDYGLKRMMIVLGGAITTLMINKTVVWGGIHSDVNKFLATLKYQDLTELTLNIMEESEKIDYNFSQKELILIDEFANGFSMHFVLNVDDNFKLFLKELISLMIKILSFVKEDIRYWGEIHQDRRFVSPKGCQKVTTVFHQEYKKIEKRFSLSI